MKIVIEEADNGYIVEEDPELMVNGVRTVGRKHVFHGSTHTPEGETPETALSQMLEHLVEYYEKKPAKQTLKRKKKP